MDEVEEAKALRASSPKLMEILNAVSAVFRIGKLDIMGPGRTMAVVEARFAFYWLALNATIRGYSYAGRFINRHHTTVLHGVACVNRDMEKYAPRLHMVARRLGIEITTKRDT